MREFSFFTMVQNNGDGSASVIDFSTRAEAEARESDEPEPFAESTVEETVLRVTAEGTIERQTWGIVDSKYCPIWIPLGERNQ
jgi:hypothetical protein